MILLGIHFSTKDGKRNTTLHVADDFKSFFTNHETGRGCIGQKVDTIFVGDYDCSDLEPQMVIEVFFDKAITTSKGTFQSVKKIEILD